jgi:hypothetical protein
MIPTAILRRDSDSDSDGEGSSHESREQSEEENELRGKAREEDPDLVLKHHFKVLIQYLTHLAVNKRLKGVPLDDSALLALISVFRLCLNAENYFLRSVAAIDRHLSTVTENVLPSTCKAPFKATLIERPAIHLKEVGSGPDPLDCAGCWQRGRHGCEAGPRYALTFTKGTYDKVTLRVCDLFPRN